MRGREREVTTTLARKDRPVCACGFFLFLPFFHFFQVSREEEENWWDSTSEQYSRKNCNGLRDKWKSDNRTAQAEGDIV